MALVGRRDGRNFGYGRQLSYAGPQALKDMFGGGHYGTVKAHSDRWQTFVKWRRSEQRPGINDARQVDRKVLANYAAYLRNLVGLGDLAISTVQNRLSSVNRTMAALRGDQYVKLPSASKALGMQRTSVRQSVPQGEEHEQVKQIVDALCRQHQLRAAAVVLLARVTGMRLREAILADLPRLNREANELDRINIQDDTKGGRAGASAPRWIAVNDHVREALGFERRVSPAGGRNLIASHESYLNVLQDIIRPARDILHSHNLKAFMSYGRRSHVNAMSKLPYTARLSTAANVTSSIKTLIVRPGGKSATSLDIVGSMWLLPILEDGHEQAIRYGDVLGWRANRVARDAATPFAAGDAYPS